MKGTSVKLFIVLALICFGSSVAFANDVSVGVEVTMPTASGITVTLSQVLVNDPDDTTDDTWPAQGTDVTLSGATLDFPETDLSKTADGVYLTPYYYVLDIAPDGGGWSPTAPITFAYTAGAPDIGIHAVATLAREEYTSDTTPPNEYAISQVRLSNLNGPIAAGNFTSGWLRVYIGLATGSEPQILGVTPLTDATPAGDYTGSVVISYTGV